ncbi:DUF389 domain-containing protein [Nakamurella sp. A5-74]|uniref:DUF389 domain-containing protein n=1 Tax=Nakamurella sp. A5-74 TaxID=3158264 RepID=A0AAU8DQ65_9ACTN
MLLLRLIVPDDRTSLVVDDLVDHVGVTNVVVVEGAGREPVGDLVTCDVTREAASDVLLGLQRRGLYTDGAVSMSEVEASPSRNAQLTQARVPGSPDDAIVWDEVLDRTTGQVRPSWSYFLFLTIAVTLASVAVVTDSSVLVIGAMVVGPEFITVTAMSLGIVLRRSELALRGLRLLVLGFVVAIAVAVLLALLAKAAGWITLEQVAADRPLTAFIWRPDHWSVVVAALAGMIGVLSQTANRGPALVGVFISVTTVPAAGDLAVSIAVGATAQISGAALQLGLNLVGMTASGIVTLLVARALWTLGRRRRLQPENHR